MNNYKKMLAGAIMVLCVGCFIGCGTNKKASEYTTYKFETFDGAMVTIDAHNIVFQEEDNNVLESSKVPENAEVIAPGRDYVYFADDSFYYVEDSVNNLVTKAKK